MPALKFVTLAVVQVLTACHIKYLLKRILKQNCWNRRQLNLHVPSSSQAEHCDSILLHQTQADTLLLT